MQDKCFTMDALLKCYDEARLADTWLTEHGNEVWTLLLYDFRPQAVQKRQFIIAVYQRCAWPSFPPLFRPILRPDSHIHRHDSHLNLEGHFSSLTEADFAPGKPHSLLSNQHFSRFCCPQVGQKSPPEFAFPCGSEVSIDLLQLSTWSYECSAGTMERNVRMKDIWCSTKWLRRSLSNST